MNEESHNDLFEIKIHESSKKLIRKVYPLVSIGFPVNILLSVIFICVSIYNLIGYRRTIDDTLLQWYLSEVGSQKSEVRSQKSEVRSQKSEVRSQNIGMFKLVRNQTSDVIPQTSYPFHEKNETECC